MSTKYLLKKDLYGQYVVCHLSKTNPSSFEKDGRKYRQQNLVDRLKTIIVNGDEVILDLSVEREKLMMTEKIYTGPKDRRKLTPEEQTKFIQIRDCNVPLVDLISELSEKYSTVKQA